MSTSAFYSGSSMAPISQFNGGAEIDHVRHALGKKRAFAHASKQKAM